MLLCLNLELNFKIVGLLRYCMWCKTHTWKQSKPKRVRNRYANVNVYMETQLYYNNIKRLRCNTNDYVTLYHNICVYTCSWFYVDVKKWFMLRWSILQALSGLDRWNTHILYYFCLMLVYGVQISQVLKKIILNSDKKNGTEVSFKTKTELNFYKWDNFLFYSYVTKDKWGIYYVIFHRKQTISLYCLNLS